MKIAVIGAGLFGCTAAIHAARDGHEVDLYERGNSIFAGTTGASYYRLHRGYHYPRSPETGIEGQDAEAAFRSEYWPAVVDSGRQYYAIANTSLIDADAFKRHCYDLDLMWWIQDPTFVNNCEALFRVSEPRIDVHRLKTCVATKLRQSGVNVRLGTRMPMDIRDRADKIIIATYENMNPVLHALNLETVEYKYQMVEKPIVDMTDFVDTSIVVIDGPFCCLDPHGSTKHHVIGHVVETVHETHVGKMPPPFLEYPSRHREIIEASAHYIPAIADCKYLGSTFTMRCVLADMEETDARPTLVQEMDEQVVRIFSGKLGTAVSAARRTLELLSAREAA